MRGVVQGLTSRGAAVTAGVTVASQGRDAGLLNWLRTHKLALRRGRSNHSEGEALWDESVENSLAARCC